jgi:hypothetical protein
VGVRQEFRGKVPPLYFDQRGSILADAVRREKRGCGRSTNDQVPMTNG